MLGSTQCQSSLYTWILSQEDGHWVIVHFISQRGLPAPLTANETYNTGELPCQ